MCILTSSVFFAVFSLLICLPTLETCVQLRGTMPTILGATYGLFNFKSAEKNEPNAGSDKEEDDKWIQIPPSLL